MSTTNLNIRVDENLKKKADKLFSELGMSMSTAMNIFLRQSVRYGGIPFDIRLDVPNSETVEAIREVKQMKADPTIGKTYRDVDQMMKELLSDV